jgi:hypothetical protein
MRLLAEELNSMFKCLHIRHRHLQTTVQFMIKWLQVLF